MERRDRAALGCNRAALRRHLIEEYWTDTAAVLDLLVEWAAKDAEARKAAVARESSYQAGDIVDLWRSLRKLRHRCEKGVSKEEASEEESIVRGTETFDDDATSPIAADDARHPTCAGHDKVRKPAEV